MHPYRYKVINVAGNKNIVDSLDKFFNKNVIGNARNDYNIDECIKLIVKYATPIALITLEIEKASSVDKELRNLISYFLCSNWPKLKCKSYLTVVN